MLYGILADLIVYLHLAFVLFVVFGGLLVIKWPRLAWLHLPAADGAHSSNSPAGSARSHRWKIGCAGREAKPPIDSDFIAQYLLPVLYPEDLTRDLQLLLGTGVVVLNAAVYWWLWRRIQARGASWNQ